MRKLLNILAVAALLVGTPLYAQNWEEGQHYQRVGNPVAMPDDRIVVIDAFGYPCPACRRFLPFLDAWSENLPDHVELQHLPVVLQPGWDLYARAFYTASVMGVADQAHEAMFKALHDERRQFRSFEDIAGFYSDFGVEPSTFINTSESFAVDARMRQNRNDVRTFAIRGTPSVIVHGKWRVSPNGFQSYDEMLEVVSYLVDREAEELGLNEGEEENGPVESVEAEAEQAEDDS